MSMQTNETGQEGLAEQARSQLGDVASTAQDKAVEMKQQGKSKLAETLDERSTTAGSQVRQLADALRQSSTDLRMRGEANSGQVAGFTESAADRIERLGSYLESRSGDEMVREAEDFARRRPWMIAGLGLLVGLATSRFLKASSERRYESSGRVRSSQLYYSDRYSSAIAGPAGDTAVSGSYSTEG